MTPEEIRRREILRQLARNANAQFDMPASPDQGQLAARIAAAKMNDYQRFGAGGNGVVLNQLPAGPAPEGDTAFDVARKAEMGKMKLTGGNRHGDQGRSTVTSSGDPGMVLRMRELMKENYENRRNSKDANGQTQPEAARARAADMASKGIQRPTRQSQNDARFARRLAAMNAINMTQVAPQVALMQAMHGANPAQSAQANYHNAMADAIRQQMTQDQGGQAAPPGAPPAQLPPGSVQIAPGVVRHPAGGGPMSMNPYSGAATGDMSENPIARFLKFLERSKLPAGAFGGPY